MHQCLVGVHHLLQVDGFVAVVGEGGIGIELLIGFDNIFHGRWSLDDSSTEDTTGEVTTIGDEVDVGVEVALYLFQTLTDLRDVLMLERLVDAQVVVAPGEMGRPVDPVMALTATSSFNRFRWAAGNRATWIQVAKQPGLATC